MWKVWLNGAWQPAANDAVVIAWIRQGYVRPDTPIQHASWPGPSTAGNVPVFQPHFGSTRPTPIASPTMPSAGASSAASKYIVAAIVGVVAWGGTLLLASSVTALGVLLLCAGTIAIVLFVLDKFWKGAPPVVRNATGWLRSAPVYALAALFVSPCGSSLGLIGKLGRNQQCKEAETFATQALNSPETFRVPDPLHKFEELKAKITEGRSACVINEDEARVAKLDEMLGTLSRQANAAVCEPLAQQALESVNAIGDSLTPQALLHAYTSSSTKVDNAISVCDRAGAAEAATKLRQVKTEKVTPGIAKAEAAIKAAEEAKARAAIEAATIKVPIRTLLNEYSDNEIRADALYKGKLVQVTGRVSDTKRDILNHIYVTLGTGRMFEIPEVQCFFEDRWARAAAQLSKGQTITVRGRVDGLMFNVLMRQCEILEW